MAKDKDYIRLIHTGRWLSLRKEVLTAHPLCAECAKAGRVEAATEVHHVRPVEEAIGYADKIRRMYDPHNLQALCHDCLPIWGVQWHPERLPGELGERLFQAFLGLCS